MGETSNFEKTGLGGKGGRAGGGGWDRSRVGRRTKEEAEENGTGEGWERVSVNRFSGPGM